MELLTISEFVAKRKKEKKSLFSASRVYKFKDLNYRNFRDKCIFKTIGHFKVNVEAFDEWIKQFYYPGTEIIKPFDKLDQEHKKETENKQEYEKDHEKQEGFVLVIKTLQRLKLVLDVLIEEITLMSKEEQRAE